MMIRPRKKISRKPTIKPSCNRMSLTEQSSGLCTKKRIVAAVLVVIAIVALVAGLLAQSPAKKSPDKPRSKEQIIVQIDGGQVQGIKQDNAFVFKGIPYAKPPSGKMRWKPPQPCREGECWTDTFNASKFGNYCFQLEFGANNTVGKEDCLVLNVWTPELKPEKKRPVLVYIHGGFLLFGSGHDRGIHPAPELVNELGIVGVSINYRLNAFGFLALDALADASPTNTSGNYGFMDQIMALNWVHNNIERFGGDPGRVTLLGQSSGGTSEVGLLASPLAKGLFHGAILMSASPVFNKSSADAAKDNEIFLRNAKCTAADLDAIRKCMYGLTAEKVVGSIPWSVYPYWAMEDLNDLPTLGHFDGAIATVDGYVVASPPLDAMARGRANDVPVVIGTTAQEIDFYPVKDFSNSTLERFENYTRRKLMPFMNSSEVDEVFKMYYSSYRKQSPQFYYSTIATDIRMTCPNDVFARNASHGFGSQVYRYIVTAWPSKPVLLPLPGAKASPYAFHMWDIQAFFGFPKELVYVPSERDKIFMAQLRRELGSFIESGSVKNSDWKGFPEKTGLFTNNGLKVVDSYHKKQCEFWLDRGFFSYGWIN